MITAIVIRKQTTIMNEDNGNDAEPYGCRYDDAIKHWLERAPETDIIIEILKAFEKVKQSKKRVFLRCQE